MACWPVGLPADDAAEVPKVARAIPATAAGIAATTPQRRFMNESLPSSSSDVRGTESSRVSSPPDVIDALGGFFLAAVTESLWLGCPAGGPCPAPYSRPWIRARRW